MEALLYEPRAHYDRAVLGILHRCGESPMVVYSLSCLREILVDAGLTPDEATDHIWTNMVGSWLGAGTPGVLVEMSATEIEETLWDS